MLSQPSDRPSVEELMRHPYFDGLDFDQVYRGEVERAYLPLCPHCHLFTHMCVLSPDDYVPFVERFQVGKENLDLGHGSKGSDAGESAKPLTAFAWPPKHH